MLTPADIHQEIKEHREFQNELLRKNPWLIPASIALTVVPMAISIHGFWKYRQLQKQLKIEREKTKQLALEHADTAPKRHFKIWND